MPRSTKPITVEMRNQQVTSGAQRAQAQWWTATTERKAELRALWPQLANAIVDLDELLQLPVIRHESNVPSGVATPALNGDGCSRQEALVLRRGAGQSRGMVTGARSGPNGP
jgi:hypothetical protein